MYTIYMNKHITVYLVQMPECLVHVRRSLVESREDASRSLSLSIIYMYTIYINK